jgi:hypothetical protein
MVAKTPNSTNFTQPSQVANLRQVGANQPNSFEIVALAQKAKETSPKPKSKPDSFDKSLFVDGRYVKLVSDEVDPAFPQHTQHFEPINSGNPVHVAAAKAGQKNYDAHDRGIKVGVLKQFAHVAKQAIKAPFELIGLAGKSMQTIWDNGTVRLWDIATGNKKDLKRIDDANEAQLLQTRAIVEHLGEIKDRIVQDPTGELAKKLLQPFEKHAEFMAQGKYYEAGEVMGRALASVPLAAFSVAFAIENIPATVAQLQKVSKFTNNLPKTMTAGVKALPKGIGGKGGRLPVGTVPLSAAVMEVIKGKPKAKTDTHSVSQRQVNVEVSRRRLTEQDGWTDISRHNMHWDKQVYAQPKPANEFGDVPYNGTNVPVVKPVKKPSRPLLDRNENGRKIGLIEKILIQVDKIPAKIGKPLLFENWEIMSYAKRKALLLRELNGKGLTAQQINAIANGYMSEEKLADLKLFSNSYLSTKIWGNQRGENRPKNSKSSTNGRPIDRDISRKTPEDRAAADARSNANRKLNYNDLVRNIKFNFDHSILAREGSDFILKAEKIIRGDMYHFLNRYPNDQTLKTLLRKSVPIIIHDSENEWASFGGSLNYNSGGTYNHSLNFSYKYIKNIIDDNKNGVDNALSRGIFAETAGHEWQHGLYQNRSKVLGFPVPKDFAPSSKLSRKTQRTAYIKYYLTNRYKDEIISLRKQLIFGEDNNVNTSFDFPAVEKMVRSKKPVTDEDVKIFIECTKKSDPNHLKSMIKEATGHYDYNYPASIYSWAGKGDL